MGGVTDVKTDLDQLATTVLLALPPLDKEEQLVGLAIYGLMASGRPADRETVARHLDLPVARVAEVFARLPTATVTDGEVRAFLGLQLAPGRHQLTVDGRDLSTWCAWDTLFLPQLMGRSVHVSSRCPVTDTRVSLEIDPRAGVVAVSPRKALLSFLAAPAPFAGELRAGFCRWIHFLADDAAAEAWLDDAPSAARERPPMIVLSLEDGFALGRRTNDALFGRAL